MDPQKSDTSPNVRRVTEDVAEFGRDASKRKFAWLRLNSYGLLFAGLLLMSVFQILDPERSSVARQVGRAPEFQWLWWVSFGVSGVLLVYGFVKAKIGPEMAGLFLTNLALLAQDVYLSVVLWGDWSIFITSWLLFAIVFLCSVLRVSALLDPEGMTITLPPRNHP